MLWTAFLLGLAGSLHCAGMCGPLVLAACGPANGGGSCGSSVLRASQVWGCLAYNFGRIATYAVWGLLFGLVGQSLALFGVQRWVSITIGVVILVALFAPAGRFRAGFLTPLVAALKRTWSRGLKRSTLPSMALLGLLNGLLPCGLVYAAGGAAVAAGGWLAGMEYMIVFGLGTLPMMLGLAVFGKAMPFRWRLRLQSLTPVALGLVAVLLIVRGLGLGIPYLSPSYAAGSVLCH